MADLSNKALSLLLLVAMVVSVAGTMVTLSRMNNELTGFATSQDAAGLANFTINSSLSIVFAVNNSNFGSGNINATAGNCSLATNMSVNVTECLGGAWVTANNLTIENTGNIRANISLLINKNGSTFIGPGGNFSIMVLQNETLSCNALNASFNASFTDVNDASFLTNGTYGSRICTNLTDAGTNTATNSIKILVYLRIPSNTSAVAHSATFTATGCDNAAC